MIIYEAKNGRVTVSQVKHKIYRFQVKETHGRSYYEAIVNFTHLSDYLEAEKKIRALGAKAKKLNDDVAIQLFLAQLNNIKGK